MNDAIITAARAALGTPFAHQGRMPGVALDCAGLVVSVAAALGLPYLDSPGYGRSPANGLLEAALDSQPCLVRVATPEPGDILLMRFQGEPQHLGIFTGETMIHAWQVVGSVCEHRMTEAWLRRVVRVYRFVEVANG